MNKDLADNSLWATASSNGVLMMLLSTILLASLHAMVRHAGQQLHPFEIAFFRNLFGLIAILPLLLRSGRSGFVSQQPRLQLVRSLVGVSAMFCWFYGLSVVPIAEATALSFMAVIFASLGAVLFLSETMGLRRWLAVLVSFGGVLVVLRPGTAVFELGSLVVLLASVCWGTTLVLVKRLSATDSAISIVLWSSVLMTVLSLPPALWVWTWPSPSQLVWLVLIGALATAGHLTMTRAFQMSEATAILPLDFTRLVWASVIGYFAFAEQPDSFTWLGGVIIFGSAMFISFREAQLRRVQAIKSADL